MNFTEKYISTSESALANPENKVVLTDDTFALCEMLNELNFRLSKLSL